MNLKILKDALDSKSIPSISRITGIDFDVSMSIEEVKYKILSTACDHFMVKLCESDEDIVISVIENKPTYTNAQQEMKQLLYRYGHHVIALEPELKEDVAKQAKQEIEPTINDRIADIEFKISMCPNYFSLYQLKEDFKAIDLIIIENDDQEAILCKMNDGKPQITKIFEDHMFIGSTKTPDIELSTRMAECLIKFIRSTNLITK